MSYSNNLQKTNLLQETNLLQVDNALQVANELIPPFGPTSEDDILLEDGDSIKLEDGSGNILLEN